MLKRRMVLTRGRIKGGVLKKSKIKKDTLGKTKRVKRPSAEKIGDSIFKKSRPSGKELGYNKHAKKVIRENPGILKAVYEFSRTNHINPNYGFKIISKRPTAGQNTDRAYILDIKNKKYYVKETNDTLQHSMSTFAEKYNVGLDGVSEHKGIEFLRQKNIETIKAHFSYTDPVSKRSFIAYDFVQLKTLAELYSSGKINNKNLTKIKQKLEKIKRDLNRQFYKNGLPEYSGILDIAIDNVFYSKKQKKYYIFDPFLVKKKEGRV